MALFTSDEPLAAVLARVERELSRLADSAADLQTTLGDIAGDRPLPACAIEGLQALDLQTQLLGDLSAFVRQLSADTPAEVGVDPTTALSLVRVLDLARRLENDEVEATPDPDGFELF